MKFTAETLNILKNYATINQNIQFKQGSTLSTISPQKNILTKAEISEDIPKTFAIFDLNQLLATLSRLGDQDFEVGEKRLELTGQSFGYTFAETSMLVLPPDKTLEVPDPEIKFEMPQKTFDDVVGMALVWSVPDFVVVGDGTKIEIVCKDTAGHITHIYGKPVGTTDSVFEMVFKIENLKLLNGDYDVEISSKGIGHFTHKTSKIEYWIATEQNSNYSG